MIKDEIEEVKLKKAMLEIANLKGATKKITSDENYELIRQNAFEELSHKIK